MLKSRHTIVIFKLGMIRFATSLLVVLLTNVLNRVLIVEFQTPAAVIAFIFAFQHLATPSGLIAGYFSDRVDPNRLRRTPFIMGGMLLSLAVMPFLPYWGQAFATQPQNRQLLWLGLGLFTLFGIGTTVSATAVNALLVDRIPHARRGAGMTLVWILTLAGFIIGSAFFNYLFPGDQINRLETIFWIFTCLALVITLGSIIGIEAPKVEVTVPDRSLVTIGKELILFGQSRQAILFFAFLAATVFFPAMQSFILTPFGGEILKLPVGETAKFGMYTSYGTLLGMATAYWWMRQRSDSKDTICLIVGLLAGAAAFALLSLSAWQPQQSLGEAGMWLFGFSKGLYNAGLSFLTMRLAHPVFSGVFMGLWNLISGLALAAGEMAGGFFLDLGMWFFGNLGAAYASVFLSIGLGLLGCLVLLRYIDVGDYWRQIAGHFGLKMFPEPKSRHYAPAQQ